jgi:hypothetical protein
MAKIGNRVKINYSKVRPRKADGTFYDILAQAFHGKTGEVVNIEYDGRIKMYRVRLDTPVQIENLGEVRDDLWLGEFLKTIKG